MLYYISMNDDTENGENKGRSLISCFYLLKHKWLYILFLDEFNEISIDPITHLFCYKRGRVFINGYHLVKLIC